MSPRTYASADNSSAWSPAEEAEAKTFCTVTLLADQGLGPSAMTVSACTSKPAIHAATVGIPEAPHLGLIHADHRGSTASQRTSLTVWHRYVPPVARGANSAAHTS